MGRRRDVGVCEMTVRERSAEMGAELTGLQARRAWPGAEEEDFEYVATDAIANLLVYAATVLDLPVEDAIRRARMHAEAELGVEGDEVAS